MSQINLKLTLGKILTTIMFDFLLDGKLNDPRTFISLLEEAQNAIREKHGITDV